MKMGTLGRPFISTILLLASFNAVYCQDDMVKAYNCVTPKGGFGRCIELHECPKLAGILKEIPINRQSIKYLKDSTCGFADDKSPKVCCPNVSAPVSTAPKIDTPPKIDTTTTTTTTTPRSQPNSLITDKTPEHPSGIDNHTESSSDPKKDSPKNASEIVISHKNLHLLPDVDECGKSLLLSGKIVGGKDAGLGAFPWVVLLGLQGANGQIQWACGGTLISKRYILTAAHCVAHLPDGFKLTTVKVGEYDQKTDPDCDSVSKICAPPVQKIGVEEFIYHEHYDEQNKKENDIAILRLEQNAVLSDFASPICLPRGAKIKDTANGPAFVVAGFGRLSYDSPEGSSVMQQVGVPVISSEKCNKFYSADNKQVGIIDASRFCAGGKENKDSCKGDSGGPLMTALTLASEVNPRFFQYGIVSVGPSRCGLAGQPALYTKVSYFMPWILDHIRP